MRIRKWLFKLHWLLGLFVGGLLVFSGLTGSLLVFSPELNLALNGDFLRGTKGGNRRPLPEIVETVRRAYPGEAPSHIAVPRRPDGVYDFRLGAADGRRVYVDPQTGAILGSRSHTGTAASMLFYLHSELLSGRAGKTVVGIGGLCLLALSVTGITLWWPGWRRLRRGLSIEWRGTWKRVNFDAHRVLGAVAAALLVTAAITGMSLTFGPSFEAGLNHVTGSPQRRGPPPSVAGEGITPPLDVILRAADEALPGAETTWIVFPTDARKPLTVRKKLPEEMHPNGKSYVHLDQRTGQVLRVDSALTSPLGSRIFDTLYPIHAGRYLGLPTRVLTVAVGLVPSLLFGTGFLMWRNRRRSLAKSQAATRARGLAAGAAGLTLTGSEPQGES